MSKSIRTGDRVTGELPTLWDGSKKENWPDRNYLGTVLKIGKSHGNCYAWIKYDSGRKDFENIERLYKVT